MSLFKRLPFKSAPQSWQPISGDAQSEFASLSARFSDLSRHLEPAFEKHDGEANQQQRSHRRIRLALIVGAMVTSVFGAIQAASEGSAWPGIALAIVAAATGALTGYERQANPLGKSLRERAKAEELRSLYFVYLGELDVTDESALAKSIAEIQFGKEPEDA